MQRQPLAEATGPSSLRYLRPFDCMACLSVHHKSICASHQSTAVCQSCNGNAYIYASQICANLKRLQQYCMH